MPSPGHNLEDEAGYARLFGSFVDTAAWFDGMVVGSELITSSEDRNFAGGTIGNWVVAGDDSGTCTYDGVNPGGEKVGKLTAVGDGTWMLARLGAGFLGSVSAGDYLIAEADVYVPSGNTLKNVKITIDTTSVTATVLGDQWTRLKVLKQVTAATTVEIAFNGGPSAGDILYFDNVSTKKVTASLSTHATLSDGDLIMVWDAAGKHSHGYIKKAQYTNETRGNTVITNGTFAAWTGDNPDNWTISTEDGTNYVTEAAGKAQIVSDSGGITMTQAAVLTSGNLYYYRVTCTTATSGAVTLKVGSGTTIATINAAQEYYGWFTADGTDIQFSASGSDIIVDNIYVFEVTAPALTAVKVYKEAALSNQGWTSIESGFDYNAGANYTFGVFDKWLGPRRKMMSEIGYY